MLNFKTDGFPELETARLLLRRPVFADASALQELRSDARAMQYIGRPPLKDRKAAEDFIANLLNLEQEEQSIFWIIADLTIPEKMIGNICLWKIQKDHARAEIGYMLHPDHWKKGIMQEAVSAITDYGFNSLNLHTIEGDIKAENSASESVLLRCGFIKEGHLKENFYYNGEFSDTIIYSLLKPKR